MKRFIYEYYPLASEGAGSSFSQLSELFLSQIDIDKQNVFTIDGTIPQEAVIEYCRLYEQRIQTFGGIDMALMGIGREGNIAMNEAWKKFGAESLSFRRELRKAWLWKKNPLSRQKSNFWRNIFRSALKAFARNFRAMWNTWRLKVCAEISRGDRKSVV